nr:unnamed protein product [Meloidogyne enterolobii]
MILCIKNETKTLAKETSATINFYLKKDGYHIPYCGQLFNTTCFKKENIRKAEAWKIVDPTYTDQEYKNLFTFHILPETAMRKTMQEKWEDCEESCDPEAPMQKCERMFVKFNSIDFKLLVPYNPKTTTTMEQTTEETETLEQTTEIQTSETSKEVDYEGETTKVTISTTEEEKDPITSTELTSIKSSEKSKTTTKNLIIFGSIITLIVLTFCCSICLFVINSSSDEKDKNGTM